MKKEFFISHLEKIKANNIKCEECGTKLRGNFSEVAHIIGKSLNPEVALIDDNIVYLCGMYSENRCHAIFDDSLKKRAKMKCFAIVKERFKLFEHLIKKSTKEVAQLRE